ncbi:MAG: hydantoinase/oxoprolinase family protein [Solirubrobacterales bacterium]|nr:hydantoinase/oxoprolinase family protein [Solirubrobacterales bacterium]
MLGVDVGGTFTDVVAFRDGRIVTTKVPTDTREPERGVLQGAEELGVDDAAVFNHASTAGVNAIITRRLPKVAFLTTEGHRDILDIGRAWRPLSAMTDPTWRRSFGDAASPLVPRYLRRGIAERMTASGEEAIALDEDQAREQLQVLSRCDGVQGVAVCLLNAYVDARHEVRLRELVAEELGDGVECSISSDVSPLAKEYARASTTVVDVFMKIIYSRYTERLGSGLREMGFGGRLNFADCAAMLVDSDFAMQAPFRIVFSGPAAGTVSGAHFGGLIGDENLLCADVGGTSCDISLVTAGQPFVQTEFELEHDLVVNALSNEISSIGAGGGSIVSISPAGEMRVGPASAGADPGPACYGKGGTEPTLTDACLLMGILDAERFAAGRMALDAAAAQNAFEGLETSIDPDQRAPQAYLMGLNNIAEGIVDIAVKHGVDPRDYSLLAYGAAGGMLLPAALELVHARRVIVPPHPGLFSALGLLSSDLVYADSRSAYTVLTPDAAGPVDEVYRQMEDGLRERLGADAHDVRFERSMDARLVGQTWDTPFIPVPQDTIDAAAIETMIESFHVAYQERAGNRFDALPVQGVTYRVQAIVPVDKVSYPHSDRREGQSLQASRTIQLRDLDGSTYESEEYERDDLRAGDRIEGPAVIREELSTTRVGTGQTATVGDYGEIVIEQGGGR